jgi:methanogenic corrinoid protein MtbC1
VLTTVFIGVLALAAATALVGWRLGESRRRDLEREIADRSGELDRALSELEIAQAETVQRLSMAVEFRDEDTGAHIERIGRLSTLLAERVGMEEEFCRRISHAAPLHDVGKVAIPDAILLKPGPLTAQERAIVETHAEEGYRLLRDSSSSILDLGASIALSHHEKWDGGGYPRGLSGEAIPIEGRIVAVADVFDALTSDRVYRPAYPVAEAIEMMVEQGGRHFDPILLDAFLEILRESGSDPRAAGRADPSELLAEARRAYAEALRRGDAARAESAVAVAIEEGIPPETLHAEVIAPGLRSIEALNARAEIDPRAAEAATVITRRILATIFRFMLADTEPSRERVLLAGLAREGQALELQMVHDQLAAAGFQVTLANDLSPEEILREIHSSAPDAVVLGIAPRGAPGSDAGTDAGSIQSLVLELRESRPDIPVLLSRPVLEPEESGEGRERQEDLHGVRVLARVDRSVATLEDLLAAPRQAVG